MRERVGQLARVDKVHLRARVHGASGTAANLPVGHAGAAQGDAKADGALIVEDRKAHGDVLAFHVGQIVRGDAGGGDRFIDRMAAPQIDKTDHDLSPPRLPRPGRASRYRSIGGVRCPGQPVPDAVSRRAWRVYRPNTSAVCGSRARSLGRADRSIGAARRTPRGSSPVPRSPPRCRGRSRIRPRTLRTA